jgi:hypothetical protein
VRAEKANKSNDVRATLDRRDERPKTVSAPGKTNQGKVVTLEDTWSLDCGPGILRLID